jgi:hypothetical protein
MEKGRRSEVPRNALRIRDLPQNTNFRPVQLDEDATFGLLSCMLTGLLLFSRLHDMQGENGILFSLLLHLFLFHRGIYSTLHRVATPLFFARPWPLLLFLDRLILLLWTGRAYAVRVLEDSTSRRCCRALESSTPEHEWGSRRFCARDLRNSNSSASQEKFKTTKIVQNWDDIREKLLCLKSL